MSSNPGDQPPLKSVPVTEKPTAASPPEAGTGATALTPEEQMALYEKELKESDWGHQPC